MPASCFRSDRQSRWLRGLGPQQGPGAALCQLAHPGCSQLEDLQRVQDPARLLDAGVQLGPRPPLLHPPGPRRLWRALWPALAAPEFCEGLGRRLRPAVSRVLPLLAGDHAHAPEMKKWWNFPLEGRYCTQCDQCSCRLSKYLRKLGLKSKSWKCDRTWRSILRWETRRRMMKKGNIITQNIEGRMELSDEKTEFTQRLSTA